MSNIKNKLIKLAYENPELREDLLRIITAGSFIQNMGFSSKITNFLERQTSFFKSVIELITKVQTDSNTKNKSLDYVSPVIKGSHHELDNLKYALNTFLSKKIPEPSSYYHSRHTASEKGRALISNLVALETEGNKLLGIAQKLSDPSEKESVNSKYEVFNYIKESKQMLTYTINSIEHFTRLIDDVHKTLSGNSKNPSTRKTHQVDSDLMNKITAVAKEHVGRGPQELDIALKRLDENIEVEREKGVFFVYLPDGFHALVYPSSLHSDAADNLSAYFKFMRPEHENSSSYSETTLEELKKTFYPLRGSYIYKPSIVASSNKAVIHAGQINIAPKK